MRTFAVRIAQILELVAGAALSLMVAVILLQVLMRYGMSDGLIWGEEFARIMMIAAALLGAAVAHWQGKHIRFDLVEHLLSTSMRRGLALVAELVVLATLVTLVIAGWELAAENAMQESLTLGMSMVYIYALVPLGFAWMAAASLRRFIIVLFRLPQDYDIAAEHTL